VRLLLDEMYSARLATVLRDSGIAAVTVAELGLAGSRSDIDVFIAAADGGYAVLTENVSDLVRVSGDHVARGGHHGGVIIAFSSRFSGRPAGYGAIVEAIAVIADQLDDRLVT
jgi:Domain of unknown function (DUF5615)